MGANIPLPALGIHPQQGTDVLGDYAKALSIRGMRQQQTENQLDIDAKQQAAKDRQVAMQVIGENGGDMNKALPALAGKISPATYQTLIKANLETQKAYRDKDIAEIDLLGKKNGVYGEVAGSILQLPPEARKDATAKAIPYLTQHGIIKPEEGQQLGQQLGQMDDAGLEQFLKQHQVMAMVTDKQLSEARAAKEEERKQKEFDVTLPGKQAKSEQEVRANAASQLAGAKDQADYEARRNALPYSVAKQFPDQFDKDAVLQSGMTPHEQASVPLDKIEMKDWLRKNPTKTPSDFAAWKASLAPAARISIENAASKPINNADGTTDVAATAKKFGMTQASFDQQAEKFYQTGTLPSLGRGISGIGLQRALMNRTAELHPNGNLAENSAEYKANQESLKKLQTQFDQVTAFENTAGKNLDVFLQTAKPIVDAGSPFLNTPLRALSERAVGSEKMAAFNAARTTALTEIAKVLNSSNASGVVSDSARHEVEGLIGPNASLKQIYAAANILKQDMKNRHDSYQDQITAIQGRFKTQSAPAQGGGNTQQPAGGGSGMAVSLAEARKLPAMRGKTDDQIKEAIKASGHQVVD